MLPPRNHRLTSIVALCALLLTGQAKAPSPGEAVYATVGIHEIGHERLATLKGEPGFDWWIEVDDQLLVLGDPATLAALERDFDVRRLDVPVIEDRIRLVIRGHRDDLAAMPVDVLAHAGRHAVVQARDDGELTPPHGGHAGDAKASGDVHVDMQLLPFEANVVLAHQVANDPPRAFELDPEIEALANEVDVQRWFADLQSLTNFNRWTHGPEILEARDWLVDQFEAMGLNVETQSFAVGSTTAHNVIATLPGTLRPDEWYLVGAHYDARAANDAQSAVASPGAEDNATGCSSVLELARLFSAHPPEATVLFLCFSGEEQGLWGSRDHVDRLLASGDAAKVRGVLNMDMISYTADTDLDLLLGSRSQFPEILERFIVAAETYTSLRVVTSLTICCSDHVPYLNAGIDTVVTASNDWSQYPHYHRSTDTAPNVSLLQAEQILRMNVAAMAEMVGAGSSSLLFTDGFESGDLSAWAGPSGM